MSGLMLGLYTAPPSTGGALLLDCSPFVQGCEFSTDAHGFERLTASVLRALAGAFRLYDYPLISVGLFWNGQIVWEGRLEDPTLYAGGDGSGFTAQALGAWRALSDLPYTAFWSTTDTAPFRPLTLDDRAATRTEKFVTSNQNQIWLGLTKGETYTINASNGRMGMQIADDDLRAIIGIQYAFEINLPTQYTARLLSFATTAYSSTVTVEMAIVGTGAVVTGARHLLNTSAQSLAFEITPNTSNTYAGETGDSYFKVTNFRAVSRLNNRISTTLTANRAAGVNVTATVGSTARMYVGGQLIINSGGAASEIVTVLSIGSATQFNATFVNAYVIGNTVQAHVIYADEIALHAVVVVNALNSTQLSSSAALLQSPGLDLLDEAYEDAAIGPILTRLAGLGDNQTPPRQWEVGVYEDRQMFFRPQGSGRAWYVDATDLSVARTLEALANSVYATYQDASGRTLRTTPTSDSASVARAGLTRRTAIGTQTTSATQAGVQQAAALQDHKDPLPRASITFEAVYDASGGRYPLWLVRSGDTITIRNLPPSLSTSVDRIRTFRITHTSYDAVADTLQVEPELPPPTLEVLLARRQEGI